MNDRKINDPRTRTLAARIAEAVAKDEVEEGCDISAGLFGKHFSAIIAEIAPAFETAEELAAWLDGLYTTEGTAITNIKWEPAQRAVAALRTTSQFYHLDGKPAHFDIDADLGQLILACDRALDFIHNGPAVTASDKVIEELYEVRVKQLIPQVKVLIENRITVKYPYSKLVEMTFEKRNGLVPRSAGYTAMERLASSINQLHAPACNLSIMSSNWAPEKDVHVAGIVRELATLTAHIQQIMILFGLTKDDIELASRQQMDAMLVD